MGEKSKSTIFRSRKGFMRYRLGTTACYAVTENISEIHLKGPSPSTTTTRRARAVIPLYSGGTQRSHTHSKSPPKPQRHRAFQFYQTLSRGRQFVSPAGGEIYHNVSPMCKASSRFLNNLKQVLCVQSAIPAYCIYL